MEGFRVGELAGVMPLEDVVGARWGVVVVGRRDGPRRGTPSWAIGDVPHSGGIRRHIGAMTLRLVLVFVIPLLFLLLFLLLLLLVVVVVVMAGGGTESFADGS